MELGLTAPLQPPTGFMDKMAAYDKQLTVGWNGNLGFKAPLGRWVIGRHRMLGEGIAHIMTVQTPGGHYMQLGGHVMTHLRKIDSWRVGHNEQARGLEETWEGEEEAADAVIEEQIDSHIEKMRWALRKDTDQFSMAHVSREDQIAGEVGVEKKLIEIATR